MNTKQLRQKILDLAIRGKLVPQDPNDEPASVLLERVRAEKEQLIKEGKIKRDKKDGFIFQGDDKSHYEKFSDGKVKRIQDEIPFDVPEGWAWAWLSQISKINMGQSPSGESVTKNMDGIEFHQGKIFFTDRYLAPSGQYTKERNKIADKNSVLLCIRAPVGIVNITDREIAIGRGLCSLFPLLDISTDFIYYWLIAFHDSFIEQATGTTFKAITADVVQQQLMPIPPLGEQKKIIEVIESAFILIDDIERNKTDLQSAISATKSKILSLAIRGKLVPQDPNDEPASVLLDRIRAEREALIKSGKIKRDKYDSVVIRSDDSRYYGNLPQGWALVRLELVVEVLDYLRQPINAVERTERIKGKLFDKLYPYYGATGQVGFIDDYLFDGKYILLGEDGAPFLEAYTDKAYIINGKTWVNNHAHILKPLINTEYLCSVLNATNFYEYVSGTTRLKLTQADMNRIVIPIPPLAEQHRIVATIESTFEQLDNIKNTLA